MRTGLTKQEKTTDIWFDEKDPLIPVSYTHLLPRQREDISREDASKREQLSRPSRGSASRSKIGRAHV